MVILKVLVLFGYKILERKHYYNVVASFWIPSSCNLLFDVTHIEKYGFLCNRWKLISWTNSIIFINYLYVSESYYCIDWNGRYYVITTFLKFKEKILCVLPLEWIVRCKHQCSFSLQEFYQQRQIFYLFVLIWKHYDLPSYYVFIGVTFINLINCFCDT